MRAAGVCVCGCSEVGFAGLHLGSQKSTSGRRVRMFGECGIGRAASQDLFDSRLVLPMPTGNQATEHHLTTAEYTHWISSKQDLWTT